MAAVLACGDGAVLSHGSAAALWRIGQERRDADRGLRSARRPICDGRGCWSIDARASALASAIGDIDGIPVTEPGRRR